MRRSLAARGSRNRSLAPELTTASLGAEFVTDCKPAAALPATPRQNCPSRLCLHPGPKAMVFDTLSVRWPAICGLTHGSSLNL